MPRNSRRWIDEQVKSFRESEVLPFHEILSADMVKSAVAASGNPDQLAFFLTPLLLPLRLFRADFTANLNHDREHESADIVTTLGILR
jgi:hypothetical protein